MLNDWLASWSAIYSGHPVLRTVVEFAHVGGLLIGGGCAITADLATILGAHDPSTGPTELRMLKQTHVLVLIGLIALGLSGLLLLAADAETYLYSKLFWMKMVLIVVLLANGWLLRAGERRMRGGDATAWQRLHRTAVVSLCLWLLTTLVGTALPNSG